MTRAALSTSRGSDRRLCRPGREAVIRADPGPPEAARHAAAESFASGRPTGAKDRTADWKVSETAVVVCDMWDDHYLQGRRPSGSG